MHTSLRRRCKSPRFVRLIHWIITVQFLSNDKNWSANREHLSYLTMRDKLSTTAMAFCWKIKTTFPRVLASCLRHQAGSWFPAFQPSLVCPLIHLEIEQLLHWNDRPVHLLNHLLVVSLHPS
jgi:hypothetical protein